VGIATLGAVTYGTFSLATHNASAFSGIAPGAAGRSAAPLSKSEQAVSAAQEQELRASILKMLDEHMGLTGPDAEKLAATMAAHMQGATQGADIAEMMKSCLQAENRMMNYGNGMMNDGTGMMNRPNITEPSGQSSSIHESHHRSDGTT
jgi:hypothetical protein